MEKKLASAIIITTLFLAGIILYSSKNTDTAIPAKATLSSDGTQLIKITAKGGYSPRITLAERGITTILEITTNESYDCSTSLVIPTIDYRKNLPTTGIEKIVIPADKATGTLNGLCSMGMYSFKIKFE